MHGGSSDPTMDDLRKIHTQICTGKRPPSDKQIRQLLDYAVKDPNFKLHKSKDKKSPQLKAQPLAMGALHELERRFPGKLAPVASEFLRKAASSGGLVTDLASMKLPEELARLVLNYEATNYSISEAGLKCLTTLHELNEKSNFGPAKSFIMPFFLKALGGSRKALTSLVRLACRSEETNITLMARDALGALHTHGEKNAPALGKALRRAAFEVEGSITFPPDKALNYVKTNYMIVGKKTEFGKVNIDQIESDRVIFNLGKAGL